jgi:hypothetical protein
VTLSRLEQLHSRQPFVPYTIHMADGSAITVKNTELMVSSPNKRTIEVLNGTTLEYIDLRLVTKLTTIAE